MKHAGKYNRLYIHVPFCEAKCRYCAFYSIADANDRLKDEYLKRLEMDFVAEARNCDELKSIYIGGGTPTVLGAERLKSLFYLIKTNFNISRNPEISIECNPETVDDEKASIISGFANRVSMGAQSFNPRLREYLGRHGSVENIYSAFAMFMEKGIKNIGLDLIYAIPGQKYREWAEDLRMAAELGVKHISAYSLSIEEGSLLAAEKNTVKVSDELSADMWALTGDLLEDSGYKRYEISNYALPGCECMHNLEIWYGDTYLGCGPAASSYDGIKRWTHSPNIGRWLDWQGTEHDIIEAEKRAGEIFIMGLRTVNGWNRNTFIERTGFDFMQWEEKLAPLKASGHLVYDNFSVSLHENGILLWDEISEAFI